MELTKAEMERLLPLFDSLGYRWERDKKGEPKSLWEPTGTRCIGNSQHEPNKEGFYVLEAAYLVDVIPLLLVHAV